MSTFHFEINTNIILKLLRNVFGKTELFLPKAKNLIFSLTETGNSVLKRFYFYNNIFKTKNIVIFLEAKRKFDNH